MLRGLRMPSDNALRVDIDDEREGLMSVVLTLVRQF